MNTREGITILYDGITRHPDMKPDWGYAALVEFDGRRILFDTGNNADILSANCAALGVELTKLDFAILSHRHWDHTAGLTRLLQINPTLPINVPADEFFWNDTPRNFFVQGTGLPVHYHYFAGEVPGSVPHGTPWQQANLRVVDKPIWMGSRTLLLPVKPGPGTADPMNELSLALVTEEGVTLIVGCSHAGIERHIAALHDELPAEPLRRIVGGLHLLGLKEEALSATVQNLVETGAELCIGHCTGEVAFSALLQKAPEKMIYAGAGECLVL
jgi:7,8-dihydropterin-6-yl-methyl-4-(beta-D-ribofuranosyl)aminobenzene 5'-phosphate synthase